LSASSEKNVRMMFCVREQGSFIWNRNLLHVSFPPLCAYLLQILVPYVPRVCFFQQWTFYSRKWCAHLFADVAGLHMLTVSGAT